jgi:hypothetical protein
MFFSRTPGPLDRRATPRHAGNRGLLCGVRGEKPGQRWAAPLYNVSATGLGLVLREPPEPGTLLRLRFWGQARAKVRRRHACVMHVTPQPEGSFVVGCAFDLRLSLDELKALS